MKTLLLLGGLILLGTGSFGQGYINTFNAFSPTPDGQIAYVRDCSFSGVPPLLSKAVGRVELLALDGTVLSPISDGTGNMLAFDGIFSLGVIPIPGSTPGQPASVILRVWDNSTGATYATALERGSVVVTFPAVGAATAPSNFVLNSNFTGGPMLCMPEPNSVALAALGFVGVILLARRRAR
ncbi:MAG TPA: hypothetical protein PLX89_14610 [Verrucomicrobiota bacterium]|nr:hypothetical protein [Verrucomicrobiales bacterium]HRI14225.1 hypothetical protein [Verrucomicrobiota bacterium]